MTTEAPARGVERRDGRRPRLPTRWQVAMTALTLLVGVVLGATLFGRENPVAPTPEQEGVRAADASVVRLIDSSMADVNAMDVEAVAAAFTDDAVFTDLVVDRVTTGGYSLALVYAQTADLRLRRTSDVVEIDGLHAFSISYRGEEAVAVVEVVDGRFTEYLVTAP